MSTFQFLVNHVKVTDTCFVLGREHVESYHEWMKSPFLQEMTGSEPLTLDEEIEMQESWRDDPDKCTFIILARELCSSVDGQPISSKLSEVEKDDPDFPKRNIQAMVGDVNLFLSEEESSICSDDNCQSGTEECDKGDDEVKNQAELDIMIAEESFRGKGIGKEGTLMMMLYGAKHLGIRRFFVKIKDDNKPSRNLFENVFGFVECNYAACFKEVELELKRESSYELEEYLQNFFVSSLVQWRCSLPEKELDL